MNPRKPPRQRTTAFDIAEIVGVSQPTVSRALSGSNQVSEQTRARVMKVAAELNYIVDRNAARLRSQTTNTLALVILCRPGEDRTSINPFYFALLGSIAAAAADNGQNLLVSFQDSPENFYGHYEDSRQADGVIVIGSARNGDAWRYFSDIRGDGCSIICWGAPDDRLEAIRADNRVGGALATRHLIETGRRDIVFVGPDLSSHQQFAERYAGYAATMENHGLTPRTAPTLSAASREEEGYAAIKALIATAMPFDGIFAVGDLIGLGALQCLKDHGISVPGSVGLVGFDGIRAGGYASPALSTVEPDFRIAGKMLVENLLAMARGDDVDDSRVPVRLLVRDSSVALR